MIFTFSLLQPELTFTRLFYHLCVMWLLDVTYWYVYGGIDLVSKGPGGYFCDKWFFFFFNLFSVTRDLQFAVYSQRNPGCVYGWSSKHCAAIIITETLQRKPHVFSWNTTHIISDCSSAHGRQYTYVCRNF